ncbi:MAG: zinc-binding alcohol dehydrogenase family protein [Gammaproteobacteria bacterium]|nr:zinc-binding alcohol dehydrogenase family protein [Gammaproteobacteria bacterium]
MKAVAYQQCHAISHKDALIDIEMPEPVAKDRDIVVKIEAVSVNPVDTKIRRSVAPEQGQHKVLGWDAAGVVVGVGKQVSLFSVGDKVWYAGAIDRQGSNAEYHAVDERIVSKMPESLSFTEAAALPLTSITAWEILFDRLRIGQNESATILVIGAAGGVGSILIQLIKQLTQLTVVATASRAETQQWVRSLGADHVINHHQPLSRELAAIDIEQVDYVVSLTNTDQHIDEINQLIKPQGKFAVIDDPGVLDVMPFKRKSVSIHWELMFTRSLFQTDDMIEQHYLLQKVAKLIDQGKIKTTLNQSFGAINASNLMRAHQLIESGQSKGKIVLTGFEN